MGVKQFLKTAPFTRGFYRFATNVYLHLQRTDVKASLVYLQKGEETVAAVQSILSELPNLFFFDMGTLLGIIRDGKLIRRDLDIDVAVYAEDEASIDAVRAHLRRSGLDLQYIFSVEGVGSVEDSYSFHGIRVDINYYRRGGGKDYCYLLYDEDKVVRLSCNPVRNTRLHLFGNTQICVPEDPETYLTNRYGQWRIPDKNYKYWEGPSTEKISNQGTTRCIATDVSNRRA